MFIVTVYIYSCST